MQPQLEGGGIELWQVLWKTFRAMAAVAETSLHDTGLCHSDLRILEVLAQAGPLPVNTIGPMVELTSGSISAAVDRLLKRALVVRRESDGDRRVRMVDLTAKGRKLISQGLVQHATAMDAAVAGLTKRDRADLLRLLRKLDQQVVIPD